MGFGPHPWGTRTHLGGSASSWRGVFLPRSRSSLAPRIHHRLPHYIRQRYRRYRLGDLHRPGSRSSADYGGHSQLVAGYPVDDTFNKSLPHIQAERRAGIDRASAVDPECYAGYGVKKINTKRAIMVTQIYPTEPNIKIVPDKR